MPSARIWVLGGALLLLLGLVGLAQRIWRENQPQEAYVLPYSPDPLVRALDSYDLRKAMRLIQSGAYVNTRSHSGNTALDLAAGLGSTELVELCLSRRANVETRADDGFTPLLAAANAGSEERVQLLIDHGADADNPLPDGRTPLMLAAQGDHREVVELLLRANARTDLKTNEGETALDYARKAKNRTLITLLSKR